MAKSKLNRLPKKIIHGSNIKIASVGITLKDAERLYNGYTQIVDAKEVLILSMEKDIEELRKCIETIKKL